MNENETKYVQALRKVDYNALRTETISAYRLGKSKTVPLMTRLKMNKHNYFVGGKHEYQEIDALLITVSLKSLVVISKLDSHIFPIELMPSTDGSATMSSFKREDIAYDLVWNEYETIADINWSTEYSLSIWKNPFALYAQTEFDKDYRKEWNFGELVYEGNNYGDTSDFLIIGVLVKRVDV